MVDCVSVDTELTNNYLVLRFQLVSHNVVRSVSWEGLETLIDMDGWIESMVREMLVALGLQFFKPASRSEQS